MLSDVMQTSKYGTATKENVLQIFLHLEIWTEYSPLFKA